MFLLQTAIYKYIDHAHMRGDQIRFKGRRSSVLEGKVRTRDNHTKEPPNDTSAVQIMCCNKRKAHTHTHRHKKKEIRLQSLTKYVRTTIHSEASIIMTLVVYSFYNLTAMGVCAGAEAAFLTDGGNDNEDKGLFLSVNSAKYACC